MIPGPVIAIDIDLHRVHAVVQDGPTETPRVVCVDLPVQSAYHKIKAECDRHASPVVLIEVADPTTYAGLNRRGLLAWMLYNTHAATYLNQRLQDREQTIGQCIVPVVAPSAKWTKGYPEQTRHLMAGVTSLAKTKKQNHDLNECQAMIWFYRHEPETWTVLNKYFFELSVTSRRPARPSNRRP